MQLTPIYIYIYTYTQCIYILYIICSFMSKQVFKVAVTASCWGHWSFGMKDFRPPDRSESLGRESLVSLKTAWFATAPGDPREFYIDKLVANLWTALRWENGKCALYVQPTNSHASSASHGHSKDSGRNGFSRPFGTRGKENLNRVKSRHGPSWIPKFCFACRGLQPRSSHSRLSWYWQCLCIFCGSVGKAQQRTKKKRQQLSGVLEIGSTQIET